MTCFFVSAKYSCSLRTSDPLDHQLSARIDAVDAVVSVLYPDLAIVPVDQPPQPVEEQASSRSERSLAYQIRMRSASVPSSSGLTSLTCCCSESSYCSVFGDLINRTPMRSTCASRRFLKPLNLRYPIMEITEATAICDGDRQMVMDFDR